MVQATQTGEPEHQPDYSDFEGTRPVSERQRFDTDALAAWLTQHVDGFRRTAHARAIRRRPVQSDVQADHAVAHAM